MAKCKTAYVIIGNVEFVLGKVGASSGLILDVTANGGVKENNSTCKFLEYCTHLLTWYVSIFRYQAWVTVSCMRYNALYMCVFTFACSQLRSKGTWATEHRYIILPIPTFSFNQVNLLESGWWNARDATQCCCVQTSSFAVPATHTFACTQVCVTVHVRSCLASCCEPGFIARFIIQGCIREDLLCAFCWFKRKLMTQHKGKGTGTHVWHWESVLMITQSTVDREIFTAKKF